MNLTVVAQFGWPSSEIRVVSHWAMVHDTPLVRCSLESLEARDDVRSLIKSHRALPLGSVEFVRACMAIEGIHEPENLTYPFALQSSLKRKVAIQAIDRIEPGSFVKPLQTKNFTGFVLQADSSHYDDHDREQWEVYKALPRNTLVWMSERVEWTSECRYYIQNGKIIGMGRYDDGPDEWGLPSEEAVQAMVETWENQGAPRAYAMDVGVLTDLRASSLPIHGEVREKLEIDLGLCRSEMSLETSERRVALTNGETALIEVNDAWAIGLYKGSLNGGDYLDFLATRWKELQGSSPSLVVTPSSLDV